MLRANWSELGFQEIISEEITLYVGRVYDIDNVQQLKAYLA